ncbi:MAG: response regulator, partial [Pseudomonadota bacterium]
MAKHLLIVDDEEQIREILREVLTTAGHRVTAVGTAAEALQVVQADPPNLVITDLQLGESDGFEVVERMKALNAKLPIVMLTGVIMDP